MRHATVLVLLPGAGADHVDEARLPFLAGLARRGVTASLQTTHGFAQTAAVVTGRHPDSTGHFGTHVFDPRGTPFSWLRLFGHGRALVRPHNRLFPVRRAVKAVTRALGAAQGGDPAWIPLRFLPYLRPLEGMGQIDAPRRFAAPGLFDVCRQGSLRVRLLVDPVPGGDEAKVGELARSLRAGDATEVYVVRLHALKEASERHGPTGDALHETAFNVMDDLLATIHASLAAGYASWDLVVCGEHTFAPVHETVDLAQVLGSSGARPGRDYVAVVHGTLAAFWCLTGHGESVLRSALPAVPGAELVTEATRRRLRIPAGRRAGDFLLAARPGTVFWRDQFHPPGPPPRGAFGYLDKAKEGAGAFVLASSDPGMKPRDVGRRHLVDVLPTLCDLLGVAPPDGVEGRSVLEAPRGSAPMPAGRSATRDHLLPQVVADV